MYIAILLLISLLSVCYGEDPKGHMQPIGSHMDKLLPVDTMEGFPEPKEFFDNYVKKNKPLLMKNAAKQYPFYKVWQNDTYLAKKFGKWRIVAEEGKKENRDLGVKYYTFRKFLNVYDDEDIYLVQDVLPQNPISAEVCLPNCLACGGFTNKINTAVMWFSSGGTKSVLHNDGYENVNCLMDGEKDIVFIDQKYQDKVPIDRADGGYSSVDVEKVDLYKYPTLKDLPMHLVKMKAGDCAYIPYRWYHHVNSAKSRNMAINMWWSYMHSWNDSDECSQSSSDTFKCLPLNGIKFADPSELFRADMYSPFTDNVDKVSIEDYNKQLQQSFNGERNKDVEEVVKILNSDNDGFITPKEVDDLPLEHVKRLFGEGEAIEYQGYQGDGKIAGPPTHTDSKDEL